MHSCKTIIIALGLCLCGAALFAQTKPGAYLNQTPPALAPAVFAPGIISVPGRYAYDVCFTKDGLECYFTVRSADWNSYRIMTTRYENGAWTAAAPASFSDNISMSPFFTDNDQTVYFCHGQDIWKAARTKDGWSNPASVPAPISSSAADYSTQISTGGNAWICTHRSGGLGNCDLWRIGPVDGTFSDAVNLRALNTAANDCGPAPGPDEAYVLWYSDRPNGYGKMDIYISYADGQGGWTAPENLGAAFNTAANENSPTLSPDRKFLFFSRQSSQGSDIYWVSVKAFLSDKKLPAKK